MWYANGIMKTWTPSKIRALKGVRKFATVTCYDATSAQLIEGNDIPLVLVGDSLGMVMQGHDSPIPVTLDDMVYHSRCVSRGLRDSFLVVDMPFMSYQVSVESALVNAGRLIKEGYADAVKIEGGERCVPLIQRLVEIGIPVVGHIGMTPQSCLAMGGFKVQGRDPEAAQRIIKDAQLLEAAGVFSLVVECVPSELGKAVTESVSIPVIGIGAGADTDGQILVFQDMLGLTQGRKAKFVKCYAQLDEVIRTAFATYAREVEDGVYPAPEHRYE